MTTLAWVQASDSAAAPIPAAVPLPAGAFWGVIVPALLLVFTAISTFLLYRRFEREESQK